MHAIAESRLHGLLESRCHALDFGSVTVTQIKAVVLRMCVLHFPHRDLFYQLFYPYSTADEIIGLWPLFPEEFPDADGNRRGFLRTVKEYWPTLDGASVNRITETRNRYTNAATSVSDLGAEDLGTITGDSLEILTDTASELKVRMKSGGQAVTLTMTEPVTVRGVLGDLMALYEQADELGSFAAEDTGRAWTRGSDSSVLEFDGYAADDVSWLNFSQFGKLFGAAVGIGDGVLITAEAETRAGIGSFVAEAYEANPSEDNSSRYFVAFGLKLALTQRSYVERTQWPLMLGDVSSGSYYTTFAPTPEPVSLDAVDRSAGAELLLEPQSVEDTLISWQVKTGTMHGQMDAWDRPMDDPSRPMDQT